MGSSNYFNDSPWRAPILSDINPSAAGKPCVARQKKNCTVSVSTIKQLLATIATSNSSDARPTLHTRVNNILRISVQRHPFHAIATWFSLRDGARLVRETAAYNREPDCDSHRRVRKCRCGSSGKPASSRDVAWIPDIATYATGACLTAS